MGWATFRAIFSQTHLVTLSRPHQRCKKAVLKISSSLKAESACVHDVTKNTFIRGLKDVTQVSAFGHNKRIRQTI
jgi:hypothetical protein